MKRLMAVAALALVADCTKPWYVGTDHVGGRPPTPRPTVAGRARADSAPSLNLGRKAVSAKEEPATLIAADRTRCTVTLERFQEVALGDKVSCGWQ